MGKTITLIVGESGCGKTTVVNELAKKYGLKVLKSYTTRKPRYAGEDNHIFIDISELPPRDTMCAYTYFDGNHYYATSEQVEESDLYVIDPSGICKKDINFRRRAARIRQFKDSSPYCQKA